MWHIVESIFIMEYLHEYEFIFETALAHGSGGPGVLIDEKTEGRKSRETVLLGQDQTIFPTFHTQYTTDIS
jgi:hypothetical protein